MTNDRELLELAAKAAGIKGKFGDKFNIGTDEVDCTDLFFVDNDVIDSFFVWNPLTDDGDCARLEAKLGICIEWWSDSVCCTVASGSSWTEIFADHEDKNAARRYASTALAAEIGRMM